MSVDTSTDAAEEFPPFIFSLDGINTPGGADVVWENIQCFSVRPNSFSQVCHYFWYHGWTGHLSGQLGHIFQLVIIKYWRLHIYFRSHFVFIYRIGKAGGVKSTHSLNLLSAHKPVIPKSYKTQKSPA